jgi:hypothetical protein
MRTVEALRGFKLVAPRPLLFRGPHADRNSRGCQFITMW